MTRYSTPPVALGASKPTVAITPSKASYTANLSLPCPLSLFVPSLPQVYHVYTEDPHVYTKVRPLMPNLPLSSLLSPTYSGSPALLPLSIASSGPLCLRLRFYCTPRRLYLRSRQMHLGPTTPKTTISTPESIMPTSYPQPRGFREIRLSCF